jgi:protein SCO1/2
MTPALSQLRLVIWGMVAAFAAIAGYTYIERGVLVQHVTAAAEIGEPFHLASSNGGFVDSKDLLGKPYGIFFGYTHCPEICPTTLYEMSKTITDLGEQAKDFRLFFVTVDPQRDTVPVLKDYLSNFDPRIEALVPTLDELPQIAKAFRVFYQKVPETDGGYSMNHTATLFLFGRGGRFVSTIAWGESPDMRLAKLKRLVAND